MDKYQRTLLENSSNEKFFSCTPVKKHSISLDSKLEDLNLKKSTLDALRKEGKYTIKDLAKYNEDGLLKLPGYISRRFSTDILRELSIAGVGSSFLKSDFDCDADIYKLVQEDDIFSTKYCFALKTNANIETCSVCINENWIAIEQIEGCFSVILDFEKRVEKVKLTFADNIVDDYIFSVQYVEADKDFYYQKQAEEHKAKLLSAAQIKHSTGADLVNIYFQPCCIQYAKTEIVLYKATMMLAKYKVEEETFFKSISGLAPGTYSYVIKQYDKKDDLLMETEHFEFQIQNPKQPIMGRINRI